jgi:hypothetical protein
LAVTVTTTSSNGAKSLYPVPEAVVYVSFAVPGKNLLSKSNKI